MSSVPTLQNSQILAKQQNNTPAPKVFFNMPSPQEMDHLINFCKVMATSPFYQKLGPGGVMAIYLTAKEYNLPFMACLNGGLHTFDGKVTFSAVLINAMIINAGHRADVIFSDETRCEILFWRCDRKQGHGDTLRFEYTIKQAEKAGYLKKTNWQTSPKDMLWSRCLTGGARKFISELLVGVLAPGELVGTDSDSDIYPLSEPETKPDQPKEISEFIKPIEYKPLEGYVEFREKHGLEVLPDGTPRTKKMEYILATCDKANMQVMQVINFAIKNEKIFEERFDKWFKENSPEPEVEVPSSMDEVSM